MSRRLKDGYIGIIEISPAIKTAAFIKKAQFQVTESLDSDGDFRSLSKANFAATITTTHEENTLGVYSVVVEINNNEERAFGEKSKVLPTSWITAGTAIVATSPEGLLGTFSINFTINNIPAHPRSYYHKFRLKFLTSTGEVMKPFMRQKELGVINKVDKVFTVNKSSAFDSEELTGMKVNFIQPDNSKAFASGIAVYETSANAVKLADGIDLSSLDDNTILTIEQTEEIYILGPDGEGIEFNGVSDASEIIAVKDLTYENGASYDGHDNTIVSLTGYKVKLRFRNMYGYSNPGEQHLFGDGSLAEVSEQIFRSISSYHVYMYVSDTDDEPVNKYPNNIEPNGQYYKVMDVPAPKKSYDDLPYIYATIDNLPYGKYICFAVFASTTKLNSNLQFLESPSSNL